MYSKCVIVIHLCMQCVITRGSLAATHLLVTRVGPCDDNEPGIMTMTELAVTTQTYDSSLSGQFNLTRDLENGWTIKGTMQKCQDIRNVDTCDFLHAGRVVAAGCAGAGDEEELYGMLFHYTDPEIECPVRAGVYKLTNYPFFTEDNFLTVYETKISTSVFGYTYKMEGFTRDLKDKIFCAEAYLQLLYMREHEWTPSRQLPGKQKQKNTNN